MASKKLIFPFKMLDLSTSRYDQMASPDPLTPFAPARSSSGSSNRILTSDGKRLDADPIFDREYLHFKTVM